MSDIVVDKLIKEIYSHEKFNILENNIGMLLDKTSKHINNIIKYLQEDGIIHEELQGSNCFKLKLFGYNDNPSIKFKTSKIVFHGDKNISCKEFIKYVRYINMNEPKDFDTDTEFTNHYIEYNCDSIYYDLCKKYEEWKSCTLCVYSMCGLSELIIDHYINKYQDDAIFSNIKIMKVASGLVLMNKESSISKYCSKMDECCNHVVDYILGIVLMTIKQNVILEQLNEHNKFGFCALPLFCFPNELKLEIKHNDMYKVNFYRKNIRDVPYGLVEYKVHTSKKKCEQFSCDEYTNFISKYSEVYNLITREKQMSMYKACEYILDKFIEMHGKIFCNIKMSKVIINKNMMCLRLSWLDNPMI